MASKRSSGASLPTPEVDIINTSHVRTFLPGIGSTQMDVILHNQLTIIRQNEDIRRMMTKLMQGQRAAGMAARPKYVGISGSDTLVESVLEATKAYLNTGGELRVKLKCVFKSL